MPLTNFQREFIKDFNLYLDSGEKDTFVLTGGAGSGKSFLCLLLLHRLALEFYPARIGVFRKSKQILKNNTIPSFQQMLAATDTRNSLYISDFSAKYKNGSEIMFLWIDPSKDPDNNNIKGLELSAALFEELNQIERQAFYTAKSRVGRWNNLNSSISGDSAILRPFILANCNPNNSWVKSEFYDPYIDGKLASHIHFSENTPADNPHLTKEYLKNLKRLPQKERERYFYNNWNYSCDPCQIISEQDYAACLAIS